MFSNTMDSRDNEINDWGTEEVVHNLTVDESISINQETKYDF